MIPKVLIYGNLTRVITYKLVDGQLNPKNEFEFQPLKFIFKRLELLLKIKDYLSLSRIQIIHLKSMVYIKQIQHKTQGEPREKNVVFEQ